MKKALYLVMKQSPKAVETLERLRKEGFNATIVNTESLRHIVDEDPGDHHFFGLRHIEHMELQESVLGIFILDKEALKKAKDVILEVTEHFAAIKGFIYTVSIEDYCGSI